MRQGTLAVVKAAERVMHVSHNVRRAPLSRREKFHADLSGSSLSVAPFLATTDPLLAFLSAPETLPPNKPQLHILGKSTAAEKNTTINMVCHH